MEIQGLHHEQLPDEEIGRRDDCRAGPGCDGDADCDGAGLPRLERKHDDDEPVHRDDAHEQGAARQRPNCQAKIGA